MRRRNNSLVLDSKENVPQIHSSSQKADKVADVSDTTAIDSGEFVDFGAFGDGLRERIMLETKFDAIFADVASKLPSIDFDVSDVSCTL